MSQFCNLHHFGMAGTNLQMMVRGSLIIFGREIVNCAVWFKPLSFLMMVFRLISGVNCLPLLHLLSSLKRSVKMEVVGCQQLGLFNLYRHLLFSRSNELEYLASFAGFNSSFLDLGSLRCQSWLNFLVRFKNSERLISLWSLSFALGS